jgi:hypothetical protein
LIKEAESPSFSEPKALAYTHLQSKKTSKSSIKGQIL